MNDSTRGSRRHALRLAFAIFAVPLAATLASPATAQKLNEDFVIAAENDRVGEVKALLARGMDPNTVSAEGNPVLLLAARAGNVATVDVLLAAPDIKVNARSRYGDTALMSAALAGKLEIVRKLRARGGDIGGPGWTPLIYSATNGHDDVVRYLLAEGASIDAVSPNGTTALMMAVRENRMSTVELLVGKGANVNLRNESGAGALDWAKRNNDTTMAALLKKAGARE